MDETLLRVVVCGLVGLSVLGAWLLWWLRKDARDQLYRDMNGREPPA